MLHRMLLWGLLITPVGVLGAQGRPAAPPPTAERLSAQEWREDIDSLRTILLRVHPDPFRRVDSASFVRRLEAIRDATPQLSDQGVAVRLMGLVASLGDGHTLLEGSGRLGFDHWYPLRFYRFTDGLHITAAEAGRTDLLGARVVSIGGRPAAAVADSVARVQQTDNPLFAEEATYYLSSPPVLHALGFTDDPRTLVLEVETETGVRTARVAAVGSRYALTWRFWGEMFGPPMPDSVRMVTAWHGLPALAFRTLDRSRPPHLQYRLQYHYTILADQDAAYMQFNFVNDARTGPDFDSFVAAMFADLDQRGVGHFVLDLRNNSGGDGSMLLPFVHALIRRDKTLNRPGHLFVLVGRQTYSAALMLVGLLRQHTNAIFVGEPAGAPLNHHGDAIAHTLPHSRMAFNVSQRYWQFSLSDDTARAMPIEVPARFAYADWVAGRDPALEAILPPGRYRRVLDVLAAEGGAAARALYRTEAARIGDVDWWQPWDQDDMRRAGQRLLSSQHLVDAQVAFELNAERFAGWWRSWDGLGEIYAALGRRNDAVTAYRRALEIAPNNWNAERQRAQVAALAAP